MQGVHHSHVSLTALVAGVAAICMTCVPASASDLPSDLTLELVTGGFTRPVAVTGAVFADGFEFGDTGRWDAVMGD